MKHIRNFWWKLLLIPLIYPAIIIINFILTILLVSISPEITIHAIALGPFSIGFWILVSLYAKMLEHKGTSIDLRKKYLNYFKGTLLGLFTIYPLMFLLESLWMKPTYINALLATVGTIFLPFLFSIYLFPCLTSKPLIPFVKEIKELIPRYILFKSIATILFIFVSKAPTLNIFNISFFDWKQTEIIMGLCGIFILADLYFSASMFLKKKFNS